MSPFAGLRLFFIAGVVLLATHLEASADKRVALVIGNSTYQSVAEVTQSCERREMRSLNCSRPPASTRCRCSRDVGNLDFKRAIRKFEEAAADADIAVVYYAGHGIEIGGVNYMIPVDAKLASDFDAPMRRFHSTVLSRRSNRRDGCASLFSTLAATIPSS